MVYSYVSRPVTKTSCEISFLAGHVVYWPLDGSPITVPQYFAKVC
uniref:Uncharacterized protein n=1 Tax=Anguilla anguilla TaxID=7936 RepID=A0A0E9Q5L0_ANGAN